MKPRAASVPRRKSTRLSPARDPGSPEVRTGGLPAEGPSNDVATRIALVAYQLYEKRGRHHGHDLEDWYMAERLVAGTRRESAAVTSTAL